MYIPTKCQSADEERENECLPHSRYKSFCLKELAIHICTWKLPLPRWVADLVEAVVLRTSLDWEPSIDRQSQNSKYNHILSSSVKNFAVSGKSWTIQKDATPTKTVKMPSRMNIHDHPGLPAIPFIFDIAAARRPPRYWKHHISSRANLEATAPYRMLLRL